MQGRIENNIKLDRHIKEMLDSLPEYVSEWYYQLQAEKKTFKTCKEYIIKLKKFLTYVNPNPKKVKPSDLNSLKFKKYFGSLSTKVDKDGNIVKASDSLWLTTWYALNSFCSFMEDEGYIEKNYVTRIKKPKNKDLDRILENKKFLNEDDFKSILKSTQDGVGSELAKKNQKHNKCRDYAIMYLLMTTGMREAALCQINIDDIDFDNQVLYITDKGDKPRNIFISDDLKRVLMDCLTEREKMFNSKNTSALFISNRGQRITEATVIAMVGKYSEDALGYRISPHKLRGGFISILYKQTENIEFCRRAVGHSNIATTQRYIVTQNNESEMAMNTLNTLLK